MGETLVYLVFSPLLSGWCEKAIIRQDQLTQTQRVDAWILGMWNDSLGLVVRSHALEIDVRGIMD